MIIPNTMDTITNLRARIDCACASTTSPLAAADLACVKKKHHVFKSQKLNSDIRSYFPRLFDTHRAR